MLASLTSSLVLAAAVASSGAPQGRDDAVEGVLLDLAGAPLEGVGIATEDRPDVVLAVSREGGAFTVPKSKLVAHDCLIVADGSPYRTASKPCESAWNDGRSVVLVAAPAVEVAGRVVDAQGRGVETELVYLISPASLTAFPAPLDANDPVAGHVRCGKDGRFRGFVPHVPGEALAPRDDRGATFPIPSTETLDLEILWTPVALRPDTVHLTGRVMSAAGEPFEGASVRFGTASTTSAPDGSFDLVVPKGPGDEEVALCAFARGLQPAVIQGVMKSVDSTRNRSRSMDLVLGGPTLSISGRALDAAGKPLAGWKIEVRDGTPTQPFLPVFLEGIAGERSEPAVTEADGSFRLSGLLDRAYVLEAWDELDPAAIRSEPIPAGSEDVVLRLEERPRVAPLRGRVVDPAGDKIAGVMVEVRLDLVHVRQGFYNSLFYPNPVVTDAAGRFEIERVPRRHTHLELHGPTIVPARHPSPEIEPEGEALFVAERRAHLRVVTAPGAARVDEVALLTPEGEELELYSLYRDDWVRTSSKRVALKNGATHVAAVACSGRTVVAYEAGTEVARREVLLIPGRVTTVILE